VRAERITYGLLDLGERLAAISTKILGTRSSSEDFVKLNRSVLEYIGWWKAKDVEVITRHIPAKSTIDDFLNRCVNLYKLTAENLSEKGLREMLINLGCDASEIKELRSIKLLQRLLDFLIICDKSGLKLISSFSIVNERLKEQQPITITRTLQALAQLRNMKAHVAASGEKGKLDESLKAFGMTFSEASGDWGKATDKVYDALGEGLELVSRTLDIELF
jgi:hypothetical protein